MATSDENNKKYYLSYVIFDVPTLYNIIFSVLTRFSQGSTLDIGIAPIVATGYYDRALIKIFNS